MPGPIYLCARCEWKGNNPLAWGSEPAEERYCPRCLGTVLPVTPLSDGSVVLRIDEAREGEARCRAILPNGEHCPRRVIPVDRVSLNNGRIVVTPVPLEETNGLCDLHDAKEEWDRP